MKRQTKTGFLATTKIFTIRKLSIETEIHFLNKLAAYILSQLLQIEILQHLK